MLVQTRFVWNDVLLEHVAPTESSSPRRVRAQPRRAASPSHLGEGRHCHRQNASLPVALVVLASVAGRASSPTTGAKDRVVMWCCGGSHHRRRAHGAFAARRHVAKWARCQRRSLNCSSSPWRRSRTSLCRRQRGGHVRGADHGHPPASPP